MRVAKLQRIAVSTAATTAGALALTLPSEALAAGGLELMPRLELLVLNVVVFALLVYPIDRLLLKPLIAVLAERDARTNGALERSEALTREASEIQQSFEARLKEVRNEAAERRARVLAAGEEEERRVLDRAREDAGRALEQVRQGVAAELEAARQTLTADASELAREAATRILGRAL